MIGFLILLDVFNSVVAALSVYHFLCFVHLDLDLESGNLLMFLHTLALPQNFNLVLFYVIFLRLTYKIIFYNKSKLKHVKPCYYKYDEEKSYNYHSFETRFSGLIWDLASPRLEPGKLKKNNKKRKNLVDLVFIKIILFWFKKKN